MSLEVLGGSVIELVEAGEEAGWTPELDAELLDRYRNAQDGQILPADEFLAKLRARRTA